MVVDIRYHLASLVAVFLALGLGILVGTSLSDGSAGRQEEWLASLEQDLTQIRDARSEAERTIAGLEKELTLYRGFVLATSDSFIGDRLSGQEGALVLLGDDRMGLDAVTTVLEQAGAAIGRVAHVKPSWNDDMSRYLTLISGEAAGDPRSDEPDLELGEMLARALGIERTGSFSSIDAPALWYRDESPEAPSFVVIMLDGAIEPYGPLLTSLTRGLEQLGIPATFVTTTDTVGWRDVVAKTRLPYVAHVDSPFGALSLAHILASHAREGAFGMGSDDTVWPASIFARSEVNP